jgi:hypothetical protein
MIDGNALLRIRDAAARLGHVLGPFAVTVPPHASAECTRLGCNLGCTVDLSSYPTAAGAVLTYACPARRVVAESATS